MTMTVSNPTYTELKKNSNIKPFPFQRATQRPTMELDVFLNVQIPVKMELASLLTSAVVFTAMEAQPAT